MATSLATLVTPVYFSNESLVEMTEKLYLKSLTRNGYRDKIEIILVDDASPLSDAFLPLIKKAHEEMGLNIRGIRNKTNLGYPGSLQVGIEQADTDFVIMSNNDIYIPKGTIEEMAACLSSNPQLGAIGPLTNNASGYSAQEYENKLSIAAYEDAEFDKIDRIAAAVGTDQNRCEVKWLIGCFIMLRKRYFEMAGGMDAAYGLGFFEEQDLLSKIRGLGKKVIVDRSRFVFHGYATDKKASFRLGPSMNSVRARALYYFFKNNFVFMKKHGFQEWFSLVYDFVLHENISR